MLAGVVIVPLFATALGGFKELGELRVNLLGLPRQWVWNNYWDILASVRYWRVLGNSLIIALLTVALTLALSSMAAFTFAHLQFFGDKFLLNYLQLGLLFPVGDRDPAAVHQDPRPRPARFLLGRRAAAGRLLARDGRSIVAQRIQAAAGRTSGRSDDGWLRLPPLFLLHHPAAFGSDSFDGRRDFFRRQLERLLAAADRPR